MSDITITITREVSETLKDELKKAARKIIIGAISAATIKIVSNELSNKWDEFKQKRKEEKELEEATEEEPP